MIAHLVKAFSNNPDSGNPAGVILSDYALTEDQMGNIAQDLDFSESVFAYKSNSIGGRYQVRYFTRGKVEVPLCGHATLALARVLDDQNCFESIELDTLSGLIQVTKINSEYYFRTKERVIGEIEFSKVEMATLLGINSEDVLDSPIVTASVGGKPKVMIPIKGLEVMQCMNPDFEKMMDFCKQNTVYGFYPFSTDTVNSENDFHARQFNPLAGINEDPQTGIAAGALALYAQHFKVTHKSIFSIEQGHEMGLPGTIEVVVKEDCVMIGGSATPFGLVEIV